MDCPVCKTYIDPTANFCIQCGTKQGNEPVTGSRHQKLADVFLLIAGIYFLASKIFWFTIPRVVSDWYVSLRYASFFWEILWAVIPLLLAFAVKKKSWRIMLIAFGGVNAILQVYEVISGIIRAMEMPAINFNF